MKLKKLTAALLVAGLSTTASAQVIDPIFGAAPSLSKGEESSWSAIESLVSVVAATVTANECVGAIRASGMGTFVASATNDGTGSLTYPLESLNPLVISVAPGLDLLLRGRSYIVTSDDGVVAFEDDLVTPVTVAAYSSTYYWGYGSAIMVANATFTVTESGSPSNFDEHIIKDFWKDTCVAANTPLGTCNGKANYVLDAGLEVITKDLLPKAKWRQESVHVEDNGGNGQIEVVKTLIQANNGTSCTITLNAENIADANNPIIVGTVTVAP